VTAPSAHASRRVDRLLRWYPKSWRARYGDEFAELLTVELEERPQAWRRTANVVWSGVVARMRISGLSGDVLEPADQVRAGLVWLGCALAVFVTFGAAMWSQLTIGWQWARPDAIGTMAAMMLMSGAMLLLLILGVLAILPVVWILLGRMARRRADGLRRPSLLVLGGASLVIIGARHFGNGWPGTGGHPWAHQGLVPAGVAAFLWASTLSISSYWAHPGALFAFPLAEVAWMVASPVALGCVVVGATKILRRLDVSPPVLRHERRLGRVAAGATALFLTGSCCWIVDGGPGPGNLFHAGAIDVSGLATMTAASVVAHRAVRQTRRSALSCS
jgi:hypothetical protein